MRVYKFLPCKFGCHALRDKRLKLSELHTLNDPFEFRPFRLHNPQQVSAFQDFVSELGTERALSCFSASWNSPVLWAHYADNHRGLCLGLDVPESKAAHVKYVPSPYEIERVDIDMAMKAFLTKYDHWRYENEIRMVATIDTKSRGLYFMNFDDDLIIREIIVGYKSTISSLRIRHHLGVRYPQVTIIKARPALDSFEMVNDETWNETD